MTKEKLTLITFSSAMVMMVLLCVLPSMAQGQTDNQKAIVVVNVNIYEVE